MHHLIRVLVLAKDATDALETARRVVRAHLVGPNDPYVWCPPYDSAIDFTQGLQTNATPVDINRSGPRWENIPAVSQVSIPDFPCNDPTGIEQVEAALAFALDEFKAHMKVVREYVEKYNDDELFSGAEIEADRFQSSLRWAAKGGDIYLYFAPDEEEYPNSIVFPWELQDLLRHQRIEEPLWVVPFDVHN